MTHAASNFMTSLLVCCYFVSSLVLQAVTGDLPPVNFTNPVFAVSGEDVTLRVHPTASVYRMSCVMTVEWTRVDGPRQLTVHVERNGRELMKEKAAEYLGRTDLTNDGSLVLHNATQQDSGKYRCVLLRGSAPEVEMFVSLTVVEVPEVDISLQRTSSNEIFLHWDCGDWNLKPQISLLDGRRKQLPAEMAQTESLPGPDNLYSVRANVNAEAAKQTGIIICRVEVPGTSVVKETQIFIRDEFHPLDSWLWSLLVPAFIVGFLCGVLVYYFGLVKMIKNLRHLLRGLIGERNDYLVIPQLYYGNIMNVQTTGSSKRLDSHGRHLFGVDASHELARRDLEGMNAYKDKIISAANEHGIHPAVIAGIISRQSQFGATLRPDGNGHTDINCFGLMQINRLYHVLDPNVGPYDEDHLKQGASIVAYYIHTMARQKPEWTEEQRLKGALACYIAGAENVQGLSFENVDSNTPYGDFSNDVVARAQWFARNAF